LSCSQSGSCSGCSAPTPASCRHPVDEELEITLEIEPEFDWRLDQLRQHFSYPVAFQLAMTCHTADKSWHDAVRLKGLGMTEAQIVDQFVD